jgi:hypothetical protein
VLLRLNDHRLNKHALPCIQRDKSTHRTFQACRERSRVGSDLLMRWLVTFAASMKREKPIDGQFAQECGFVGLNGVLPSQCHVTKCPCLSAHPLKLSSRFPSGLANSDALIPTNCMSRRSVDQCLVTPAFHLGFKGAKFNGPSPSLVVDRNLAKLNLTVPRSIVQIRCDVLPTFPRRELWIGSAESLLPKVW